jgi:integrase
MPGHTPAVTAKQAAAFSRDHVFVTRANTPLKNNLLARFYAICKRAGIDGAEPGGSVDIHSLRGTFTTLAIENGASPKAVQSILGHSTLALTMGTYAKATERAKRDAVSALPFAKASTPAHIVSLDKARTVCSTPISNSTQAVAAS